MISIENLTKMYGDVTAVSDLSFEIDHGNVYGFLGPNGAGKSTTMNIITGCLSPTSGRVTIDGYDILGDAMKAKRLIGYLPENPPLYMNETPAEYLRFVGEAKGLRGSELYGEIEEVLDKTRITEMRNRRISALSKGYRQRVGIAQALLGSPRIIILDEPTIGLDPIQVVEMRDLIRNLGQAHTVIFSSHILSEVQAICDRVLIISHGELVAFDTPENLESLLLRPNEIAITVDASRNEVDAIISRIPSVTIIGFDDEGAFPVVLIQSEDRDLHEVSRALFFAFASVGKAILETRLKETSLEDVFLELTEKGVTGVEATSEQVDADTDEAVNPETDKRADA